MSLPRARPVSYTHLDVYKRQAECFRRAVSFGVPLDAALRAATINPAQAVGLFDELGSITAGKRADILAVSYTHLDVYKRQGWQRS